MYKKVDLFYDPIEGLYDKMTPVETGIPLGEMNRDEQAFLCGLIKKSRPRKVLEIGVAAGGTTAVIVNCLSMLGCRAEVYSVDNSERYYRSPKERTGYLYDQVRNEINGGVSHKFLLGKSIPFCIDDIGKNIDFLILDTMHSLPGEVFDFLCVLPYLSENAIVVMHDVAYNLLSIAGNNGFATKVLFSAVTSHEKYYDFSNLNLRNIGAFKVEKSTMDSISDVFSALSITWSYMPDAEDIKGYIRSFRDLYKDDELYSWLKWMFYMQAKKFGLKKDELDKLKNNTDEYDLYIYGTGKKGKKISELLSGHDIKGYCTSKNYSEREDDISSDYHIDDIIKGRELVILAADSADCYWNIIENGLRFIIISDEVWKFYDCQ